MSGSRPNKYEIAADRRNRVLPGQMFGKWCVVSGPDDKAVWKHESRWLLLCACSHTPNGVWVRWCNIQSGATHGCLRCRKEMPKEERYWRERFRGLRARCSNPKSPTFAYYGGRGISVHAAWQAEPGMFVQFVRALPGYSWPEAKTLEIDRIDNDGNYEPGNIRLVTRTVNVRNTSRNRMVVWHGQQMVIKDFIRNHTDLSWSYAHRLLAEGKTLEQLAQWPRQKRKRVRPS